MVAVVPEAFWAPLLPPMVERAAGGDRRAVCNTCWSPTARRNSPSGGFEQWYWSHLTGVPFRFDGRGSGPQLFRSCVSEPAGSRCRCIPGTRLLGYRYFPRSIPGVGLRGDPSMLISTGGGDVPEQGCLGTATS